MPVHPLHKKIPSCRGKLVCGKCLPLKIPLLPKKFCSDIFIVNGKYYTYALWDFHLTLSPGTVRGHILPKRIAIEPFRYAEKTDCLKILTG